VTRRCVTRGESLRGQLEELLLESLFPWICLAVFAMVTAALEWWRWASGAPPSPIALTLLAVAVAGITAWKWRNAKAKALDIKLGLKGERATGQFLQSELLPLGYHVIHDCCFEGFNVDHVAIGPGGVFSIETKTRSKPHGDVRVTYDGERVLVDGFAPDRDPIMQARAGASRIKEVLREYTGKHVVVRPAVLFPGWFIEANSSGAETWVLTPKALVSWIGNEPIRLTAEEVHVLASGLARYVRGTVQP
jgi:hypothetical protein